MFAIFKFESYFGFFLLMFAIVHENRCCSWKCW